MLIAGQRVDHAECLQVNARTIYYGQVKKNEAGKKIREGLGVQIVLSDTLDKDGQLVCRFEGEWKDDKMHGQGKLEMEEETYTGEFYEGLANGSGTYKFANGDFYSGSFTDGDMNGEGSYFMMNGECTEGIFNKSFFMQDGVPMPPYMLEDQRNELFKRLYHGTVLKRQILELPEATIIDTPDKLVANIHDSMKMRQVVFIARSTDFEGNLETILKAFDQKKADYLLYSLDDIVVKEEKAEFLYGAKSGMEEGYKIVINLDYRLASKPQEFASSHYSLTDAVSTYFLNRDSQAILKEFELAGIPDPSFIHHEFMIILVAAMRADLKSDYRAKFLNQYKWLKEVNRLQFLVITNLAKPKAFYETEYLEESVNFKNIDQRDEDFVVQR